MKDIKGNKTRQEIMKARNVSNYFYMTARWNMVVNKKIKLEQNLTERNRKNVINKHNQRYAIFNGRYQLIRPLGEGLTSKVYLCREIKNSQNEFALKIFRKWYLRRKRNKGYIDFENESIIL
jgi:serine/threonine-protein kinase RIO1